MILAYIDPGFGQMVWLTVVSALTGVIFHIKKTRAWIVGTVLGVFRRKNQSSKIPEAKKITLG
jgi:hypothetical protein